MILIELTAAINASGALTTFYLSSEPFVSRPTDTPANAAFIPALIDPGVLGTAAYSDGRTGGGSKLEVGEIVVANSDGQFDAWLNYGFDGRPLTIRSGTGGAYPADFPALLAGTVESIEADFEKLVIRLRDRQYILQKPVLTSRYAGTNVAPNGLEGTDKDLKDKPKPRVLGRVFNIAPPQVNASKLTYQVNNGPVADIGAVYDRGAALTKGTDYSTSAAMQSASPSSGTFITCMAEGYFRLGGAPAGQVTADVVEGRLNHLLNTAALDLSPWTTNAASVTANPSAITAPDGTITADKLTENSANTVHFISQAVYTHAGSGMRTTYSHYVKAAGRTVVALELNQGASYATGVFNLTTGVASASVVGTWSSPIAVMRDVGGGWWRCEITATKGTAGALGPVLYLMSGSSQSYAGDGTSGVHLWGAQLETAPAATGHMPAGDTLGGGRTVADVLSTLAQEAGVPADALVASHSAALDIENPAVVGVYLDGDEHFQAVMDDVAAGVGAYYAFAADGIFHLGRLTPPVGTIVAAIGDYDCLEGVERRPAKDNGVPVWRAVVRHSKVWATQSSDLAGAVATDRRAYLAEAFRDEKVEDASIKIKHLMAGELTVESLLTGSPDAKAEAQRLLSLHKVRRDIFEIPVPLDAYARWVSAGLAMMNVVSLTLNRFGLGSGKSFRLIGVRLEMARRRAILTLWG